MRVRAEHPEASAQDHPAVERLVDLGLPRAEAEGRTADYSDHADVDPEAQGVKFDDLYEINPNLPAEMQEQMTAPGYGPPVRAPRAVVAVRQMPGKHACATPRCVARRAAPPPAGPHSHRARRRCWRRASASRSTP